MGVERFRIAMPGGVKQSIYRHPALPLQGEILLK